jgi:hypothetical protein
VGSADIVLNGPSNDLLGGKKGSQSDGIDDFGITSTPSPSDPANIPQNKTFGFAVLFQDFATFGRDADYFGVDNSNSAFRLLDNDSFGPNETISLLLRDSNGNEVLTSIDKTIGINNPALLIVNKNGNTAQDVKFYTNNSLSNPISTVINRSTGFDHNNYSQTLNMGFFGRNTASGIDKQRKFKCNLFEFSTKPYSQSERKALEKRRGEV